MDIHKLLKRQLDKSNLSLDDLPKDLPLWQEFIGRINQAYQESDQERYLNERSMEISSHEMMRLNDLLKSAQHIAKLGYWAYQGGSEFSIWSNEINTLLNLNQAGKPPLFLEFIKLVHEQDRYELEKNIKHGLKDQTGFESEIRIKNHQGEYHWYRTIGQYDLEDKQLIGILLDIDKSKTADEQIKELNKKILSTARQAGMAEVATTILHNIGNILNSSNVSISLLKKSISDSYLLKLLKIITLLNEHNRDLGNYLTNDTKGQLIPQYLSKLSALILDEHHKNSEEIDSLIGNLKHIEDIVSMQKLVSGISNLHEKIYIPELIESVLSMTARHSKNTESIEYIKEYHTNPLIDADKSKLLQILVNLIQNANDAVILNTSNPIKEIKLIIMEPKQNNIEVRVEDNGVGIEKEDLERIFAFGYTNKENGHGFGLHSSALAAQEMGGTLIASSAGAGQGAQFTLTLPIDYITSCKGAY